MSLEEELLHYLDNNHDRFLAFEAHSQRFAQGKVTAFMYYYLIGKTFGDGQVPFVLPLLLKELEGHPKKQEALRCYHQFAINRLCGRCGKIVYMPEEMRVGEKSWHRNCFKCMETGCDIVLDLRSFHAHAGKLFCPKHVPK